MEIPVYNVSGQLIKNLTVSDLVFGVAFAEPAVHQALLRQQANARQGTSSTKNRSEVNGSTRKLFRQKGTGEARAGSSKSPLRPGGGVVFGPKPRDYSQAMPKKMRRLAIRSLLSNKLADGELIVVDALQFAQPRTKDMIKLLSALKLEGTVLLALEQPEKSVILSARNLGNVKTLPARQLNVGDLMRYDRVLLTEAAVREIEALWGAEAEGAA